MTRPLGGYIGFNRTPNSGAASGIWTLDEAHRYRRAAAWPGADPDWSSVDLRMTFDDSIADLSTNARTVTAYNGAARSSAEVKYGSHSLILDGTNDYLNVSGSLFVGGTGAWTIEAWIRPANLTTDFPIITGTPRTFYYAYIYESSTYKLVVGDGTSNAILTNRTNTPAANTWWHVALVRSGGIIKAYEDGVEVASSATGLSTAALTGLDIGRDATSAKYANGYVDDLRITVGVARYTAAFTPPQRLPTS